MTIHSILTFVLLSELHYSAQFLLEIITAICDTSLSHSNFYVRLYDDSVTMDHSKVFMLRLTTFYTQ